MKNQVRVEDLDNAEVVYRLMPGDVIVREDGMVVEHLHAIERGFVFDQRSLCGTHAEIVYAPVMRIEKHFLPVKVIAQAAAWLASRQTLDKLDGGPSSGRVLTLRFTTRDDGSVMATCVEKPTLAVTGPSRQEAFELASSVADEMDERNRVGG